MTRLVVLALLCGAPDAGLPAPLARTFDWEVPKLVGAARVGDRLEVNGVPLAISVARSKWDGETLLRHYTTRFEQAGFFIPPRLGPIAGLSLPRVVALDVDAMVSYIVYVWPEPDRTTTLVLGAADLKGRKPRGAPGGSSRLPVFPGATAVTTFELELAHALSFVAKGTEAEVLDYYRATLPAGGWVERAAGEFAKGGRVVRVLARPQKGSLGVVVLEEADLADALPAFVDAGAK